MHRPRIKQYPLTDLLSNEELTIKTFLNMIEQRQLPFAVFSEYHQAVVYSQQWKYECVAKKAKPCDDIDLNDLDDEVLEDHIYWEHSRHLSAQNNRHLNDKAGELQVDLGIDHDWTKQYF